MKKLISLIVMSLALGLAVNGVAEEPVAKVTVEEIRADASVISGTRLISTGQPDEAILTAAKDAGVVAVIDMRGESEDRGIDEAAVTEALGLRYVTLPVTGAEGVNFDNAAELDRVLGEIDGPVLMHCASGNRVGALMALRASMNGADAEEALAVGKAAGLTRLEPVVVERLQEK